MNRFLLILITFLLAMLFCAGMVIKGLKREKNRLESNQSALLDSVSTYRTQAGKWAASCQTLELKVKELRQGRAELVKEIEDFKVKLRRLQSVSTTQTQTQTIIKTFLKDTVIYRDTGFIRLQSIKWADPWVTVTGTVEDKKINLGIVSRDTLLQVVHRVPRRFLGIPYGTKAIRQEIRSSNPHTKIVYTEFMILKKK